MLVTRSNFQEIVGKFSAPGSYGLDSESSGLKWSDTFFAIILSDKTDEYYFNFWPYDGLPEENVIPRDWLTQIAPIFLIKESTWFMSDAKFDMRMLGVPFESKVHCIQAVERVLYNNLFPAEAEYGLRRMAERRGMAKDDSVGAYIAENKLFTTEIVPGKKQAHKLKRFYDVPFDIMLTYGLMDARLALDIGLDQTQALSEITLLPGQPDQYIIVNNEILLTKSLLQMEAHGIRLNVEYTKAALANEEAIVARHKKDFEKATGLTFIDGRSCLVEAFSKLGEKIPKTALGNASFNEAALEGMTTPVAQMVNTIRKHTKRANTYYSSYLHYADINADIHVNFRQMGTETGRLSCWQPNMQNCPKEDNKEDHDVAYPVRGCFIPRDEHCFVAIDYSAQEYRLMLDYSGEKDLIDRVNQGLDLHQSIADMVGVTRKQAKTLSFAILYGAGISKLAVMLGIGEHEASLLREKYFSRLPKVMDFINTVTIVGERRGFIWNWAGRKLGLTSSEFAYILPNHLIQGGAADTAKMAMNKIHVFLHEKKSKMLLQIHDELLFEIHKEEFHLIEPIKQIMESIYPPKNGLPLTVDVSHSWKSWAYRDMLKGLPVANT